LKQYKFSLRIIKYTSASTFLRLLLLLLCASDIIHAQKIINAGSTGFRLIDQKKIYNNTVLKDRDKKMVDLREKIPGIGIDLKYAGTNNFTGQQLYPTVNTSFLRAPAAMALFHIQKELNTQGLALKIFDAYRPYSVTVKMWNLIRDERYVADPKKGSGHNRGISVDLTLMELKSSQELNMGTSFDNFTDTAHVNFKNLSAEVLKNRQLLKSMMEKYHFKPLETEWWHFTYSSKVEFEVLDLPFSELRGN
jgi:D-alanyl-D-alanine dipeptidase